MGAEQSSPTAVPPQRRAAQPSSTASSAAAAAAVSSRSPLSESAAPRAPGGAPILSEPDVELQPLSTASKPPSPATVAAAAAVSPSTVPAISQASASGPVPQPPQPALVAAPSTLPTSSSSSHSPPAQPRRSTPASLSLPSSSVAQQPASSVSAVPAVLPLASVPAPLPVVAVSSSSSAVLSSSSSTVRPAAPSPSQPLVPVTSVPQPANAVLHPLGEQPIEEKKQEEAGKQPGPEALVEAKEEVANERPAAQQLQQGEAERSKQRSTGGSGFWRFVLCGCGTAATDPPQQSSATARPQPPPQPAPPVAPASAPTVPAVLPVVSDPVVQQPQQSAAIPQAAAVQQPRPAAPVAPVNVQQPRPQPGPSPSPGQPASVVVSSSVPVAKGAIPIAAPAKHASATSATAASPPPVVQPSQPTVSAASLPAVVDTVSPGDSAHDSDEPVRLMHPVYSHLPLLNIPAAALSLYPPHRPPVPDPTEQRAFALQRQLPPPKSLAAPFLLTSLTDPFIPSSTSDSAFQSTADWSYAQLLDILHACRQTREKFFDNSYPPSHESLFAHFEPKFDTQQSQLYTEVSGQRAENGVRWCRASEMQKPTFTSYFSSWRVMNDVIAASDVRQGGLGTCYAVASMCSLVDRYPHFVRSLFLTHDYSPEGVYQIRLCRDGVWRVLTIDDFLPCLTDSNWFRFTHAVDAQLWPALLEKAYSKMYGSYKALESGLPTEVLSDLTGSPSFRVDMHPTHATAVGKVGGAASTGPSRSAPLSFVDEQGELDVLWLQMLEWKSRGYIFCASCDFSHRRRTHGNRQFQYATSEEAAYDSDEAWQTNYARLGLVTSHAYSVLDVVEAEGGVRLIKLRNPWGRFVWHGEWSRGPQTKEQKEREQAEERKRAETKVAEQKRREETARKPEPKTWKELMKSALSSVADSVSDASSSASAYYPASRNANTAGGAAIAREDKGLFWMTWNDFTLHFSTLYVCQFVSHPDVKWQELRMSDSFAPHVSQQVAPPVTLATAHTASTPYYSSASPLSPSATVAPSTHTAQFMYELLVSAPTHVFLTLSQPDKRGEPPTLTPVPVYQPLGLHLLQSINESSALSEGKFSFVPAHFQLIAYKRPFADRQVTLEALLPSITSRYLLLPDAMLYGVVRLEYVLAVHADRPVYCRRIPLLPNALSVARRLSPPAGNVHSSLLSHFPCRVQEICPLAFLITYTLPHSGSVYIIQNKHQSLFLHIRFDCSASTRVLCSRPGGVASDIVEPRTEQCVMLVGGVRGTGAEREAEVVVQYTYQFRRDNVLPQYSVRTQHHPAMAGVLDYHQPRPIVTEVRV